jgi:uncharacterized DUF497 family protein
MTSRFNGTVKKNLQNVKKHKVSFEEAASVSDETVRIISARKATAAEETQYGEQTNAKRI